MRHRAPDKEADQKGHAERLCKRLPSTQLERGMLWIVVDGRRW